MDLFFLQYDLINQAQPLPNFTGDSLNACVPLLRVAYERGRPLPIVRIHDENSLIARLVATWIKGKLKGQGIDNLSDIDLLTNDTLLRSIPDGLNMSLGVQTHYLLMENASG